MKTKAWIITPWAAETLFSSYQTISPSDVVVAVDGGLARCHELGIGADYLCGDMDSLDPSLLQAFPPDRIWRFPKEKNETDTELALMKIHEMGIRQAVICNDMQGRVDHLLGLIQNLQWARFHNLQACIQSSHQILFIIDGAYHAQGYQGCLLSLVALNEEALLKSSSGLKWSLQNLVLKPHLSRGISNLILEDYLEIELVQGAALTTITKIS